MARSDLEAACQGIMYKEEQQEAKQKGFLVDAQKPQPTGGWTLTNLNI